MEKKLISVRIDGKTYQAEKGSRLLDVCRREGINIPTLCEHSALPGFAGCRLCVVEQNRRGWKKLVTACEYPLMHDGEEFTSSSDRIWKSRILSAQLLAARAPEAKEVLEKALGKEFENRFPPLGVDNSKCVLCGLCYRYCHAQGTAAIYVAGRGAEKVVTIPYGEASPDCIGCGACAEICPTGAIAVREPKGKRAIWRQIFSLETCPSCGRPHITAKMVEHIKKHTGLPEEIIRLCPECRETQMSGELTTGIGGKR